MAVALSVAVPSCKECGIQSSARCPSCKRTLCVDHFPAGEHQPCATLQRTHPERYACYVCGAPALPRQWSTTPFAHYIDSQVCAGCGRRICDEQHTRRTREVVRVAHEGLRGQRYHITYRYCALCAPVSRIGGIRGAAWWTVSILGIATAGFLAYIELLPH